VSLIGLYRALFCDIIKPIIKAKGAIVSMIQTYQGYFRNDGYFVADSPSVKLPTMRRVIVNILDDEHVEPAKNTSQQRAARLHKVLQDALAIENDELTGDDWDELANIRVKTNAGMSRAVNL
jgi:DNA-directed RNA polymerase beta subunit